MFKSIRWKFITIYFLLVFMAMVIVGAFIMQQFEEYYLNVARNNLTKLAQKGLIESMKGFDDLDVYQEKIQQDVNTWARGVQEEIFVINRNFEIIASSNVNLLHKKSIDALDEKLLMDGWNGKIAEKDDVIWTSDTSIATKNMVFPILAEDGSIKGILYLRADLSDIYENLDKAKMILTQATLMALLITVVLGYFIAKSVTEPIMDVTVKAEQMAKGDFRQTVEVKSDDEIGRLAEMFNYLRDKLDITLSEISSEKSKLETILRYMADGLIAVDNQGRIIHANPAAMRMINLSEIDIQTKHYDEIIGVLNERLMLSSIKQDESKGEGRETIRINDSVFLASYAPFRDEKGMRNGIVMIIQDITERQKLDNMRKEFVANVSHELKTPLTSIKSYTETLLEGALEDKNLAKDFLNVINSETDRMNRLVRDLLQLSRLDYEKEEWNKKEGNLVKIVENAILKVSITAKNKKQKLSFSCEKESFLCWVDIDKIEQVILNVLTNAIKYTPEHGEINIGLTGNEEKAILTIKDNGIGIPQKDISRVFERFYRVDKARSRMLGGTGLGLSIAKQILEAHDGTIDIQSEEGKGTEVIITLPLLEKRCNANLNSV
ncbi:MAG TPA: cell wall metabolism sensor histidine kinase WalK [Clostridiales bacterium]|nr:cell wall metabolism sensor histidine kinase WalK [Clostridiales bacterium]